MPSACLKRAEGIRTLIWSRRPGHRVRIPLRGRCGPAVRAFSVSGSGRGGALNGRQRPSIPLPTIHVLATRRVHVRCAQERHVPPNTHAVCRGIGGASAVHQWGDRVLRAQCVEGDAGAGAEPGLGVGHQVDGQARG